MAKKVFNMQGGMHSAAAYSAFENRLMGASVKASPDSFLVSAGAGMNANISVGDGLIRVDAYSAKRIQTTAVETALVPAASAAFNRIDSVVAYIDTAVVPTTAVIDNVNDVLKFMAVAGTAAATPAAPTGAAIQNAIGAGNPYLILANVTVPQNAANLAGATFDNLAPTPLLKQWPIGAVYISVDATNPQTLFGGKWAAFAAGRTLVGYDAGDTDFNASEKTGGAKTTTLAQSDLPKLTGSLGLHGGENGSMFVSAGGVFATSVDIRGSYRQPGAATGGSQSIYFSIPFTLNPFTQTAVSRLQPFITTYMWKRTG